MPFDYVNELAKIASFQNVVESPSSTDWMRIEKHLNLEFPDDYKDLVSKFGTGCFGVALYLKNPVASSEHVVLSHERIIHHFNTILDLKEASGCEPE
jgi:hypothetical protein